MSLPWYQNSYRRLLVDMHISDLDDAFLSRFDPADYLAMMQTAGVDTAEIYLQSHAGLCYFPTKSGVPHRAFAKRPDAVRELTRLCRENGLRVVGYYSLIFNTAEEDRHPDWAIVDREGLSARQKGGRYGYCCPNNGDYRAFLEKQIAEIADYFTLDGIFFDMTFWPAVCYCPACRARFKEETGHGDLPDLSDPNAPHAALFRRLRYDWMAEFAAFVTALSRRLMPGVTVTHNNASAVEGDWKRAVDGRVGKATDYCGGDLYGGSYKHSFCMKYYYHATPHLPFEYMNARAPADLSQHTLCKTREEMALGVLLTAAHHGATMMIDAMDPVGTLDPRVYRRIGEVLRQEQAYEPYLKTGRPVEDIGVFYVSAGRHNGTGQKFHTLTCSVALSTKLTRAHVAHGVVSDAAALGDYPLVCLPAANGLTDTERAQVVDYVKNGGCLYFSGAEDEELLKTFFGGRVEGYTNCRVTYLSPTPAGREAFAGFEDPYPLPLSWQQPLLAGVKNATVLARVETPYDFGGRAGAFASIHSDPPGVVTDYPAVLETTFGRGRVLWSAAPVEEPNSPAHAGVTLALLDRLLPAEKRTLFSTAPRQVELVAFADETVMLVSAADHLATDERLPVAPFEIALRTAKRPDAVVRLPDETPLPFTYENGLVRFTTEPLTLFDMYAVRL